MNFFLSQILQHPLTRGLSIDDPLTTKLRRQIIRDKGFLKALYAEWYTYIADALKEASPVLEVGAGAGFLKTILPRVISSEIFATPDIDLVFDACRIPLKTHSLGAMVMTDVFHHLHDARSFLHEASRCICPGGKIVMIEPWHTPWSHFVYTKLHHEPFLPESDWSIPSDGPLSRANGALPWIIFKRDQQLFSSEFPQWTVKMIKPIMPLVYLLSGGVSTRTIMPKFLYKPIRSIEKLLLEKHASMFAIIELARS